MKKRKFFISTAIDYPSSSPHIGHALEKIQADVLARYKRSQGYEVHFSSGTDEHGLKIQRIAQKDGKKPQIFVDKTSKRFKDLWKILNISINDFVRTSEKRHIKVAKEIIKRIYKKGDIYKGKYRGLYCVDCESYYLVKDLKDNKCPVHFKPLETIEEETYFFRMSKYQKQLLKYLQRDNNFIVPETKKNEIINRLKEPLKDLSISRANVNWGITFPLDKKLTVFVWIEALCNYLTTIDYPSPKFKEFWPTDIHVIGKDIVWHHSVIWDSLLLSLGLSLPKRIFVHGFITSEGQKMSKSLGNVVDPFELVEKYGVDPVRYYLLREFSSVEDGDFSIKRFEERYNADLANGLGNLVSRVLTLANKVDLKGKNIKDKEIQNKIEKTKDNYQKALEEFKFNDALESVWQLISFSDEYIEKNKPWQLIKENKEKAEQVLLDLLLVLKEISSLLEPFLPETAGKIKKQKTEALFPRL